MNIFKEMRNMIFRPILCGIDENSHKIEESTRKVDGVNHRVDEVSHKIDEASHKIDEVARKTNENMRSINTAEADIARMVSKTISRQMIQHLDYHLTTHCNLNCKGCSTFSPIAKNWFAEIDSCREDMLALRTIMEDDVQQIHLLGGEPLLHPSVEQFAVVTRKIFPKARIEFTTNGLLIKQMGESFWKTLRQTHTAIKFTRYPISLDYDEMVRYVEERGVTVFSAGSKTPISFFRRIPMNPVGVYNMFQSYIQCPYTDCAQLRDGKLFRCPAAAFSDILNQKMSSNATEPFSLHQRDFVDLRAGITKQDVLSFLSMATPFCSYCDMTHMNPKVKWEPSQKQLTEWVDL